MYIVLLNTGFNFIIDISSQSYLHPLVRAFGIKFVKEPNNYERSQNSRNFIIFRKKNLYLKAEITAHFTTNRFPENIWMELGVG